MAQATSGIRAALSQPAVYEAYQRIAGAKSRLAWITTDPIQSLPGMRTRPRLLASGDTQLPASGRDMYERRHERGMCDRAVEMTDVGATAAPTGPIARGSVARVGAATALAVACVYTVIYLAARDLPRLVFRYSRCFGGARHCHRRHPRPPARNDPRGPLGALHPNSCGPSYPSAAGGRDDWHRRGRRNCG